MNAHALESDVLLARAGDEAAFRRLVELSGNAVCSIALAISRDVQASEDIAQESYLAAWSNLHNLKNPASFLPWLRQVTRNQAHLWRRSRIREVDHEPALVAALDPRPTPVENILADEEQRLLDEVLDQLPDDAREILVLYYREESSTKQVSLLLGISEEAVRQRLSRSRALVREEMLQRFGRTVARTAPGAAFVSAIAGAMTFAAPSAAAAVAASGAVKAATTATIATASLVGGILGWFGVLMGMRSLEPAFDAKEARELRAFRNLVLALITVGCPIVALGAAKSLMLMVVSLQSLYIALALLYAVMLPKILSRRTTWERSVDPEVAKANRRRWMWATAGRACGFAIAGTMLMGIIALAMN